MRTAALIRERRRRSPTSSRRKRASARRTRYEVGRACDVFTFAANAALQDDGQIFPATSRRTASRARSTLTKEPLLGVISAITPFNHPLNQVAHKIAPASPPTTGWCSNPPRRRPLRAVLADILYEAGLPPRRCSIVTGDPREIADEMLVNDDVELVTFTGGVPIGKYIAAKAVYKRQVLELGGNDPIIVMEDADLDEAAALAAAGSYKNSGQRCTAVKRMLVHDSVPTRSSSGWSRSRASGRTAIRGSCDGDGHRHRRGRARNFEARVNDAVAQGAKLLAGNVRRRRALFAHGDRRRRPGDERRRDRDVRPRLAGHPLPRDIDHAIAIANGTAYGLSSAVCRTGSTTSRSSSPSSTSAR